MPPVRGVLPKRWRRNSQKQKQKQQQQQNQHHQQQQQQQLFSSSCSDGLLISSNGSTNETPTTTAAAAAEAVSVTRQEYDEEEAKATNAKHTKNGAHTKRVKPMSSDRIVRAVRVVGRKEADQMTSSIGNNGRQDHIVVNERMVVAVADAADAAAANNNNNNNNNEDESSTDDSEYSINEVVEEYILSGGQHPIFLENDNDDMMMNCVDGDDDDDDIDDDDDDDDMLQLLSLSSPSSSSSRLLHHAYPIVQTSSLLLSSSNGEDNASSSSSSSSSSSTSSSSSNMAYNHELLRIISPSSSIVENDNNDHDHYVDIDDDDGDGDGDDDDDMHNNNNNRMMMATTTTALIQPTISRDYSEIDGYSMDGISVAIGGGSHCYGQCDFVRVNSTNSSVGANSNQSGGYDFMRVNSRSRFVASTRSFDSVWGEEDDMMSRATMNSGSVVDVNNHNSSSSSSNVNNNNLTNNNMTTANNNVNNNNISKQQHNRLIGTLLTKISTLERTLQTSESHRHTAGNAFVTSERRNAHYEFPIQTLAHQNVQHHNDIISASIMAQRSSSSSSDNHNTSSSFSKEIQQLDRASLLREAKLEWKGNNFRESPNGAAAVHNRAAVVEESERRNDALTTGLVGRLEDTVEVVVGEYRDVAERLVDAEDALLRLNAASREEATTARKSRSISQASSSSEEQVAVEEYHVKNALLLHEQTIKKLEATVDRLIEENGIAAEKLVESEDARSLLESALGEVERECMEKSLELKRAKERQTALDKQNLRLEGTVELLVEDYRNMAEDLVDAEEERDSLNSVLRDNVDSSECRMKSQELEQRAEEECQTALEEQKSRLEATEDMLVEDCNRHATEKLVDAEEDASESLESRLKAVQHKLQVKTRELERAASEEEIVVAEDDRCELSREVYYKPQRTSAQESERASTRQIKALNEQNSRLEATIELLVEDFRSASEKLVDAEDEVEASTIQGSSLATELLYFDSVLREVNFESQMKSQELKRSEEYRSALDEQQFRLEATVNLLVDDLRNVSEKLVDMEDECESVVVKSQELERAAAERQNALHELKSRLEATIGILVEDNRNATEKLVDAEEELVRCHQHVSQLEEEKELLQKEVTNTNRERFMVLDRANNCDKQHRAANQKLTEKLEASTRQVDLLEKSMSEAVTNHTAKIDDLVTEIAQLRKELENATSSVAELTAYRDKLSTDLECSMAKNAELESANVKSEECARNVASYCEALDAEKKNLEVKLSEYVQSHKELTQRYMDSEANIQRMSGEVIFTHEEMSRLSMEKEAIMEESTSQLQQINGHIHELEKVNFHKTKDFQELWMKSSTFLREKELAMATVNGLQHEREHISIKPLKEQMEQSENLERSKNENNQQKQQIETMMAAGGISREMDLLLEKGVAVSHFSKEKEASMKESKSQLLEVKVRVNELEEENKRKSEELQELSNAYLLEKELAMAKVEQCSQRFSTLQQEAEEKFIRTLEEQAVLSAKVEELQNRNEQQKQQIETLVESEETLTANLSAKIEELQSKNKKQMQRIESMIAAEMILREMTELLGAEKEVTKQELGLEIEYLRRENTAIAGEMAMLKNAHGLEMEKMQNEEEDLTWKINALTQNMTLRLTEKDATISQLNKLIQDKINETKFLKNEISKRDADINSINLNARLPNHEAMVLDQQGELKQNDAIVSDLRMEVETRYKPKILRMQSKVDRIETWPNESVSFATPPCSPSERSSNPQGSPHMRRGGPLESPASGCSNPQSSTNLPSKKPRRVLPKIVHHDL